MSKLKDVCDVVVPMRDKPKAFVNEVNGIPWCRIEDIQGKYLYGTTSGQYVDKNTIEQMNLKVIPKGTVICACTGASIGTYAITKCDLITNQTFAGLVCGDKLYNQYLYYFVKLYTNAFINKSVGCAQAYITRETFENIDIDDISFEEQKKVVKVLEALDEKIINNASICSNLEAMAKLIYDYWFVQFDFPDENGKPYKSSGGKMVWNDELKREIPIGWEVTTIGEITVCHDSKRIPVADKDRKMMEGDIPYYGATGIMGYVNKSIFSGDYVLLAEDGSIKDEKGYPIIQRISGSAWVNNHAHVLEPIGEYSCKLLMMILKDIPVVKIETGSIQKKINKENMNTYKIVSIPKYLIGKINNVLNPIDKQLIMLYSENQQLASLRDFLLPMLMNGQVKVGA